MGVPDALSGCDGVLFARMTRSQRWSASSRRHGPVTLASLFTALALMLGLAAGAWADDDEWLEEETNNFVILCRDGWQPQAEDLRLSIEDVYEDLQSAFGVQLATPITVRLYPSLSDYLAANPLAVEVEGIVAQSHRGRREIGIPIDSDSKTGYEGATNGARYGLAHLFVHRLSDGRMPAGLQEGIAAYLLRPEGQTAEGVAKLREAWRRDALFTWSDLASPGSEYLDPPVSYPEALSVAHFLVQKKGFPAVADFSGAVAVEESWREALETAFDLSADDLESEWHAWLPSYLDGGWRFHALYTRDLSAARALVDRGDHAGAIAHLSSALSFLSREEPALAEEARELLASAELAGQARASLLEAQRLLSAADYAAAALAAAEALDELEAAGDTEAITAAAILERAELGLVAQRGLEQALRLPPWRVAEARMLANDATAAFSRLGNDLAAEEARRLRTDLDRRQAPAGWTILALGTVLLAWNVRRRRRDRVQGPA